MANIFSESPVLAVLRNSPEVKASQKLVHDVYGSYAKLWELRDAIDLLNGVKRDMWGDEVTTQDCCECAGSGIDQRTGDQCTWCNGTGEVDDDD